MFLNILQKCFGTPEINKPVQIDLNVNQSVQTCTDATIDELADGFSLFDTESGMFLKIPFEEAYRHINFKVLFTSIVIDFTTEDGFKYNHQKTFTPRTHGASRYDLIEFIVENYKVNEAIDHLLCFGTDELVLNGLDITGEHAKLLIS